MGNLDLSLAIAANPRSLPVLTGKVRPEGIDLHCSAIHGSELFWRQLAFQEFEISEMSMSSFMMARANGDDTWIGLPIFTTRRFFHTEVLVRDAAGIAHPSDLAGKRVGVPEYQQTAALWTRGILQHEYGVDPTDIHWYMERPPERSHGGATGFKTPPGIDLQYIPTSTDIGEMLADGSLDATLLYIANAHNLVDRGAREFGAGSGVSRLFPDQQTETARYFEKTGIYPINHCIVVRRDVVDRYPWVMLNLYSAFLEAKDLALKEGAGYLGPYVETGLIDPKLATTMGRDLHPYGVKSQQFVLDTVTAYSYEQGLTPRHLELEELFYPATLEL